MANPRNRTMAPALKSSILASGILALITGTPVLVAQVPPATPSTAQSVQQILQQAHSASPSAPSFSATSISIAPEGIAKLKLTPGSMIALHVFEEPDFDGNYRLDDGGTISIPMVGTVAVGALSLHQAEEVIHSKFIAAGVLNEAHVTVNLIDYAAQYVSISGEVASPGRFPVFTPRKLADFLALAGGMTAVAGNEIVITRAGHPENPMEVVHYRRNQSDSTGLDVTINPGDAVLVKRAGIVYILGAVYRPGGFIMQNDGGHLNVVDALALAAGTSPEAAISRVRVLRKTSDGNWVIFPVPLNKIQKGEATPQELQAEDIVYVPPSLLKETGINAKAIAGGVGQAIVYRIN